MGKCDCHCYNANTGNVPEVVVDAPYWAHTTLGERKEKICLDACIAVAVQELWRRGVVTIGSCCGHGLVSPSVVIEGDAQECAKILAEIDERCWDVLKWELFEDKGEHHASE